MPVHDWTLPHVSAHKATSNHREQIMASSQVGCFYCSAIYSPTEIREWWDGTEDYGTTARCPRCGIDSVIGSASGFPITTEFLKEMKEYWF